MMEGQTEDFEGSQSDNTSGTSAFQRARRVLRRRLWTPSLARTGIQSRYGN